MIEARAASGLPPNPHGQELANVSIIMCALAGLLVLCRLATRTFHQRSVGWDDYTLVASMALAIGMTVCFNMEVYYGMGLHTKQVTDPHYNTLAFTWLWAAQLLYKFANGLTKISIVLLYLRVFPSRKFRIISFVFIGYVVAYCTAAICISIWQCDPIAKAWHKTLPGHCIDIGILWYTNSVFTLIADLILIILPINQIVRLKLPMPQKLGLVFIFSLGIFVMACTIIRCVMLGPTVSNKDSLYYQAQSNSWTFLEVDVSIICASLPLLKAPISRVFPKLFGKMSTHNSRSHEPHTNRSLSQRLGSAMDIKDRADWQQSSSTAYVSANRDTKCDSESDEEQILPMHGITKTTDVQVEYEEMRPLGTIREKPRHVQGFDFDIDRGAPV